MPVGDSGNLEFSREAQEEAVDHLKAMDAGIVADKAEPPNSASLRLAAIRAGLKKKPNTSGKSSLKAGRPVNLVG